MRGRKWVGGGDGGVEDDRRMVVEYEEKGMIGERVYGFEE